MPFRQILHSARVFVFLIGLTPAAASAATITYNITGMGSGSLDGVAFTNADFDFTMVGNTNNYSSQPFQAIDPLDSTSLAISGLGQVTVEIPTRLGINGDDVFLARAGIEGLDMFDFYLRSSPTLTSSFGPLSGSDVYALDQFEGVATSGGALSFSSASNIEFSSGLPSPAPEPVSWSIILVGLGATGGALRWNRRAASSRR